MKWFDAIWKTAEIVAGVMLFGLVCAAVMAGGSQ